MLFSFSAFTVFICKNFIIGMIHLNAIIKSKEVQEFHLAQESVSFAMDTAMILLFALSIISSGVKIDQDLFDAEQESEE